MVFSEWAIHLCGYTCQAKHMWKALRALGAFATLLKQAIRHHRVIRPFTRRSLAPLPIPVPSAADIPILRLQGDGPLPMPFASDTSSNECHSLDWTYWRESCVNSMLTSDFMTDGEWCGYLSENESIIEEFGSPMINIKLVTTKRMDPAESPGRFFVTGSGKDGIGNFRLHGEIHQGNRIIFKKHHLVHPVEGLKWKCLMTPFGIYGTWGSTMDDMDDIDDPPARGAIWLWKRSWKPYSRVNE